MRDLAVGCNFARRNSNQSLLHLDLEIAASQHQMQRLH
jgi:hypothetical protein